MTKEDAKAIVTRILALPAKVRGRFRADHDAEWRLICMVECGWIKPDGITDQGTAAVRRLIDKLDDA